MIVKKCILCGKDIYVYIGGVPKTCTACRPNYYAARFGKEYYRQYYKKQTAYRKQALDEAGNKCSKCGTTVNLHVHHKDGNGLSKPRAKQNNEQNNLVVLCNTCHQHEHYRRMEQNRKLVIKLRRRGDTFQKIADKLGVSRQRVHQLWNKANNEKVMHT